MHICCNVAASSHYFTLLCLSSLPSKADPTQPAPQSHFKVNQKSKIAQRRKRYFWKRFKIPTIHAQQAMLKTAPWNSRCCSGGIQSPEKISLTLLSFLSETEHLAIKEGKDLPAGYSVPSTRLTGDWEGQDLNFKYTEYIYPFFPSRFWGFFLLGDRNRLDY